MARAPEPIQISKRKVPGVYRVFVFGESAALGDPEPAYAFSRILRELLEERCPGTKFEVINVGMTAISSHVILRIAQDCAAFEGDLWIIYMGNNEVVGPFGAGSVFGSKAPPWSLIQLDLAAKSTRLGQGMDALVDRLRQRGQPPKDWQGMKMFLNEQVRSDDPVLKRVYSSFQKNLAEIVSLGAKAGAKVVVCSVGANLKDCAPFASLPREGLPEAQKIQWTNLIQNGLELESDRQFAPALAQYQQASDIDGSDAVLAFRLARCYEAMGEPAAAHEQYLRARDLDTLRFRADSTINQIVSNACATGISGLTYFDADAVIRKASPEAIPGEKYFWDHVHFNFEGNYRIACGLAERVIEDLHLATAATGKVLTGDECAGRLALTDWDQSLILEQMWRRVHEPPFTGRLGNEEIIGRWSRLRSELQKKTDPQGLARAADVYVRALARRNDDWMLHHRFALLLEAEGDFATAEQHWQEVIKLVPDYPDVLFKLGEVSASQSKLSEAASYYERVLRLRPDSFEAMNGLGLVRMSQDRLQESAELFGRAIRTNPKFSQAHVNLGLLSARSGSHSDAEAHYREALRGDPKCAAAHINLANLLAAQQKHSEAISHYQEAVKLSPSTSTAHLSLANSLAALGRATEALEENRIAVRLNPKLPEAQFNLGVALAKGGDLAAATLCFQAAVKLAPSDPQAHLNLGVALAKQQRLAEAIPEFEAVLRLDPANQTARQFLKTAAVPQGSQSR